MRGREQEPHAQRHGEVLVRFAKRIGPGVYNLGHGDFVSVKTPVEQGRSREPGDNQTTVEVFYFSDNLLLTGKKGWLSSGLSVSRTRNFGFPHTQIDPIQRAFVDRGEALPRVEVNADTGEIPSYFPQRLESCLDAVLAAKPTSKLPNVSEKDPLGSVKIGKYIVDSVEFLLREAQGKNKLPTEISGAPTRDLLMFASGKRPPDSASEISYGEAPGITDSALFLLDESKKAVVVRRYTDGQSKPVYQVIAPAREGDYRTYTVNRENLSLLQVVASDDPVSANAQIHPLQLYWVPSGECIEVVKTLDKVIAGQ